jgi:hypothetical protein
VVCGVVLCGMRCGDVVPPNGSGLLLIDLPGFEVLKGSLFAHITNWLSGIYEKTLW